MLQEPRMWRSVYRARLAKARADLLCSLIGLDDTALITSPVFADWTAANLLSHIASWDELFADRLALNLAGRTCDIQSVDMDERNAVTHAERRDWSFDLSLSALIEARKRFLDSFARVNDDDLDRETAVPWGAQAIRQWAEWRITHDEGHTEDIRAWREWERFPPAVGPTSLVNAALRAARKQLLTVVALWQRPEYYIPDNVAQAASGRTLAGLVRVQRQLITQAIDAHDVDRPDEAELVDDKDWDQVWTALHRGHRAVLAAYFTAPGSPAVHTGTGITWTQATHWHLIDAIEADRATAEEWWAKLQFAEHH